MEKIKFTSVDQYINTFEGKTLEKLIELKTKFAKIVYALQGSAGLLGGV